MRRIAIMKVKSSINGVVLKTLKHHTHTHTRKKTFDIWQNVEGAGQEKNKKNGTISCELVLLAPTSCCATIICL